MGSCCHARTSWPGSEQSRSAWTDTGDPVEDLHANHGDRADSAAARKWHELFGQVRADEPQAIELQQESMMLSIIVGIVLIILGTLWVGAIYMAEGMNPAGGKISNMMPALWGVVAVAIGIALIVFR